MSESPRTAVLAVVALVLGVLALLPSFFLLAGVPALLLGLIAVRNINASDGRLRGRSLAVAAVLVGVGTVIVGAISMVSVGLLALRETSHRTTTQEHFRRIGIALNQYHDYPPPELRAFPPAGLPNANLPPDRRLSWLAGLLPFLDQTLLPGPDGKPRASPAGKALTVWEGLRPDLAWDAAENRDAINTSLAVFLSPANLKRSEVGEPAWTNCVGFSGVGATAALLPQDDADAGFFGFDRKLTREMIQADRGTSNLLTAAETGLDNGPWASASASVRSLDPASLQQQDPERRHYSGPGRPFGGLHPGGLNVLRADGSVRFQSDAISPQAFEILVRVRSP